VQRLQELRGTYGIMAPAPICADDAMPAVSDPASCQVVQAPAGAGSRLVPDVLAQAGEGEIRLTYRELSQLIEDAVRSLR
jgi:hypothetical protein